MVDAAYSRSVFRGEDCYDIEHRIVRKASGETLDLSRLENLRQEIDALDMEVVRLLAVAIAAARACCARLTSS